MQLELLTVLLWSCFSITAYRGSASCQQLFRGNYGLQRASSLLGCTGKKVMEVILLWSACQQASGGDPSLLSTGETCPECRSDAGLTRTAVVWTLWRKASKGPQIGWRYWSIFCMRKSRQSLDHSAWFRGILPMCTHVEQSRWSQAFSLVLGGGTRGTDRNLKHGKFHLKLRKTLFTLRMASTNHVAQSGSGVSILGGNQSLTGHHPGQFAVAAPALSRGWIRLSPDEPSSLSCDWLHFTLLPFCHN